MYIFNIYIERDCGVRVDLAKRIDLAKTSSGQQPDSSQTECALILTGWSPHIAVRADKGNEWVRN